MSTRNIKIGLSEKDKLNMKNEIYDKVSSEVDRGLKPSGTDTANNILAFTENKGIYVATDTGGWYYWKQDVSKYVYGGVFQAPEIPDGSVTPEKLSNEALDSIFRGSCILRKETLGADFTLNWNVFTFYAKAGDTLIFERDSTEKINILVTYSDGTTGNVINGWKLEKTSLTLSKDIIGIGYYKYTNEVLNFSIKVYIDNQFNVNKLEEKLNKNIESLNSLYEKFYSKVILDYSFDSTNWGSQTNWNVHDCYYKANNPLQFKIIDYVITSTASGLQKFNILVTYSDGTKEIFISDMKVQDIITKTPTKDIVCLGVFVYAIGDKVTLEVNPITNKTPYENKKVLFMGDSITALGTNDSGWLRYFNNIIKPNSFINVAVNGARWKDNTTGIVYDGNPTYENLNYIGNQVQKVINNKNNNTEGYEDFDIIIIAAGTNDGTDTGVTLEKQFTVDGDGKTLLPLEQVNRTMFNGAIRYSVEKLQEAYPNVQIFLCTPIQSVVGGRTYQNQLSKRNSIIEVADRLSIPYIDTFKCGIYSAYEIENSNGKYLIDGLHPNVEGAKKIAEYNTRAIINWFNN